MKSLCLDELQIVKDSRTPQGVRGLKYLLFKEKALWLSRTPQGVRGLKWRYAQARAQPDESHPARGAWIEMHSHEIADVNGLRRTPQGVRGLK